METGPLLAVVCLFMPMLSALLIAVLGGRMPKICDLIGIGTMGVSLLCAIVLGLGHATYGAQTWEFTWITMDVGWVTSEPLSWTLGITVDGLTTALLLVVTLVSFLVHLFSKGYMHGDDRYVDFYRWLGLFTFSMLGLILSDNLLTLFVFWEVMGLASYKLIGHYFFKQSAFMACKKAFMTTRVGDIGMFLALLAIYLYTDSLQFKEIFANLDMIPVGAQFWIAMGLFMGAAGKSAQFPLHIWLPDAMEGPTPVSALIHAATMVAAGVYLVGRMYTLIVLSPGALVIISIIGCFTALMAASIAFTRTDIKQVLAYSTVSQLGFMFTALGVGSNIAWKAGLFHLATHAMFKACLFLGSGSVIHGCHHLQDMTKMGGLRKKMPITAMTYLVACLAIAGFPFTAGFWSKDMILQALWAGNGHFDDVYKIIYVVLALAAAMTAAYMFRSYFLTFEGKPRDQHVHDHAHESPWTMTTGLIVLATMAIAAGYKWHDALLPNSPGGLEGVLSPIATFAKTFVIHGEGNEVAHHAHTIALYTSLTVAFGGMILAGVWYMTAFGVGLRQKMRAMIGPLYGWASGKFFIDEFVQMVFINTSIFFAELTSWIDSALLDGFVDGTGSVTMKTGAASGVADDAIVDGAVTLAGNSAWWGGALLGRFQSGRIRNYLFGAVASVALFAVVMLYIVAR